MSKYFLSLFLRTWNRLPLSVLKSHGSISFLLMFASFHNHLLRIVYVYVFPTVY